MARKHRPPPRRFLTLGWRVIDWAEAMLVHGPGDVQGSPLRLTDEACAFLVLAYRITEQGRRVVRRAGLFRPKGWAKTELAGIIAAAELCGPVRFDGFNADGDPVGRPVTAARVKCYATEEGQAGETYSAAAYMLEHGEAFNSYRLDVGLGRTFLAGGGELAVATSAPTSAEGGKTTFAVFDESHLWDTPRRRELHRVVLRNLGKRGAIAEPWSLETSNMYRPGDLSVAEALHRYWQQLVDEYGSTSAAVLAAGVLLDHREPRALEGRLADVPDRELVRALREVYGDAAAFADFERIIAEIRDPETDDADARRFWLNQAVRGDDAWLDELELELYDELAKPREVPAGSMVALGFDGSLSDDATVLLGCTIDRDAVPYAWPLGVWEVSPDAGPRERSEWVVDRDEVLAVVDDAFDAYDVLLLFADPAYWTPEVAAWASRYGDDVVREYPTHRDYRMGPAQDSLRTALVTRQLEHDGDPRVRRHVSNARRRRTRHGVTLRKDRPGSPNKIDAAVAWALAFAARNDAIGSNLDDPRTRRRKRRRRGQRQAPSKLYAF